MLQQRPSAEENVPRAVIVCGNLYGMWAVPATERILWAAITQSV